MKYTPGKASEILYKLLKSAEANAVNNNELDRDSLYVSEIYANKDQPERIRPRAGSGVQDPGNQPYYSGSRGKVNREVAEWAGK